MASSVDNSISAVPPDATVSTAAAGSLGRNSQTTVTGSSTAGGSLASPIPLTATAGSQNAETGLTDPGNSLSSRGGNTINIDQKTLESIMDGVTERILKARPAGEHCRLFSMLFWAARWVVFLLYFFVLSCCVLGLGPSLFRSPLTGFARSSVICLLWKGRRSARA